MIPTQDAPAPTITIVGVGALGSHVAMFLRNAGKLRVIDFDRIEAKNLLGQFCARVHLGKNKAQSLASLMAYFWGIQVHAIPHKLRADNARELLVGSTLVLDCLDNAESRWVLRDACVAMNLPLLHGALGADGAVGIAAWDRNFAIDEDTPGAPTCEGGEHLPFIAQVAAHVAGCAQAYLREGRQFGYLISRASVVAI